MNKSAICKSKQDICLLKIKQNTVALYNRIPPNTRVIYEQYAILRMFCLIIFSIHIKLPLNHRYEPINNAIHFL